MDELVGLLQTAGVLGFRKRARSKVGVFTVVKTDGSLRLVVDCRLPNALHKPPPYTDLATAGAFANLKFSDEALGIGGGSSTPPLRITVSELDLVDSFYQFSFEEVGSFFCLDHRVRASQFSVTEVFDDDTGGFVAVGPDDWLWPAFRVMPMGWTWSLWLCHGALVEAMVHAEP